MTSFAATRATKCHRSSSVPLARRRWIASITVWVAASTITTSMVRKSWKRWARSVPNEFSSMSFTPSHCARLHFCS